VLDDESRAVGRLGPGEAEWQEREQPKNADQDGGYRWSVTDLGFSSLNWQDGGSRPSGLSATQLAVRRLLEPARGPRAAVVLYSLGARTQSWVD
jgi:hypothetical protein